jgi:glc operon protein GlcG
MFKLRSLVVASVLCVGAVVPAVAQQPAAPPPPPTTPYGPPIALDAAEKVMAAAEAEAMKNNWPMAIVFSTALVIS